MKIVTFNIRNVWDDADGQNSFIHRAGFIYEKINSEKPDIVAFQEVKEKNLALLKCIMPEYSFYGQYRGADYTGEGLYTAIRNDSAEVVGMDNFWLSHTPDVPGSKFNEETYYPRICVTVTVKSKDTGKILKVYNVHLDHESEESRVLGIKCVIDRMNTSGKANVPCVVLGDFNALPDSECVKICDGTLTDVTKSIEGTFHNFGRLKNPVKIDYIYVTNDIAENILSVNAWKDAKNGIYLSDHYPVCMELGCL